MAQLRTFILLAGLTVLLVLVGDYFGGTEGMTIALMFALVMNFVSYWYSDKIVLSMYRARPVSAAEAPELHEIVEELAVRAGIPKPRVYVIDSPHANAFATGRDPEHAAVVVTTGILNLLDRRELRGVLSHELSHIKNRDILVMSVAATLATAIFYLSRLGLFFGGGRRRRDSAGLIGLLLLIFAPIAAMLIQLAISRSREYLADESGAKISHDPLALASALEKLAYSAKRRPLKEGSPTTAHLFIVNPFAGGGLASLFSTHPPIEKRIERLYKMAGSGMRL